MEPAYLRAVKDDIGIQVLIDKFSRKLGKKVSSLETTCQELERIGHANGQRWNHINIFSTSKLQVCYTFEVEY